MGSFSRVAQFRVVSSTPCIFENQPRLIRLRISRIQRTRQTRLGWIPRYQLIISPLTT